MQLSTIDFFKYKSKPAQPYAFFIGFSDIFPMNGRNKAIGLLTDEDRLRISQAVRRVILPKYSIDRSATTNYGSFDFVVPVYDINNLKLTIVFEETDDCLISYKFLGALMGVNTNLDSDNAKSYPAWQNVHRNIAIKLEQYDTYENMDTKHTKGDVFIRRNPTNIQDIYWCKLENYKEPSYNRTITPGAATVEITFLIQNNELGAQTDYIASLIPDEIVSSFTGDDWGNLASAAKNFVFKIPFFVTETAGAAKDELVRAWDALYGSGGEEAVSKAKTPAEVAVIAAKTGVATEKSNHTCAGAVSRYAAVAALNNGAISRDTAASRGDAHNQNLADLGYTSDTTVTITGDQIPQYLAEHKITSNTVVRYTSYNVDGSVKHEHSMMYVDGKWQSDYKQGSSFVYGSTPSSHDVYTLTIDKYNGKSSKGSKQSIEYKNPTAGLNLSH